MVKETGWYWLVSERSTLSIKVKKVAYNLCIIALELDSLGTSLSVKNFRKAESDMTQMSLGQ